MIFRPWQATQGGEDCHALWQCYLPCTQRSRHTHTSAARTRRHLEDIDNRGHRHNLHVCGLPETIEPDHIAQSVTHIFDELLDRHSATLIEIE